MLCRLSGRLGCERIYPVFAEPEFNPVFRVEKLKMSAYPHILRTPTTRHHHKCLSQVQYRVPKNMPTYLTLPVHNIPPGSISRQEPMFIARSLQLSLHTLDARWTSYEVTTHDVDIRFVARRIEQAKHSLRHRGTHDQRVSRAKCF